MSESASDEELMARLLAEGTGAKASAPASSRHAIPRRAAGTEAPLSFAQRRLWFLDQLVPGNAAYNISAAFQLSGVLDLDALASSVHAVVARHDALRTVFAADSEGQPVQRVVASTDCGFKTEVVDLEGEPDAMAAARERVAQEEMRPFDLKRGPLIRVVMLRLAPTEHVIICTLHHIVSDGWSTGVLIREIGGFYAAEIAGTTAQLPDLLVQYADFAAWQNETLAGSALEQQLDWWQDRLAALPTLALPTDYPRPAVQDFGGGRVQFSTDGKLRADVHRLARDTSTTLFATLLTAYQVALAAWSGQRDFAVGSPVAGRTRGELEPLIGFFVNTLVLRAELEDGNSFRDLLERTRRNVQEALARQDVPFEKLVEVLNPNRELGTTPLVQAVFSLETQADGGLALPGVQLTPLAPHDVVAKFDLTLALTDGEDGLTGSIDYAASLFAEAGVERFGRILERVLQRAAAHPDAAWSTLVAPDAAERAELARWGEGDPLEFDTAQTVPDLIAEWVKRAPEALAITDETGTLTYAELWTRAGRIAAELQTGGKVEAAVVAVCLPRSVAGVVAQLGIWRAGATYLPLDPVHPTERLVAMVADAGAKVVVTDAAGTKRFTMNEVVNIEQLSEGEMGPPTGSSPLAYVIYTSGSTGKPKGVEIEHGALLNLVHWHRRAFDVSAADRATLVAGVAFDAAVWETWPYLASGAHLHVVPTEAALVPERLRDWLVDTRATVCFAPTPLAERLLELPWSEKTTLRWLLAGGDRLRRRPPETLPFRLSNNYGPTEHAVVATSGPVVGTGTGAPDLGRPIANTTVRLRDADGTLVPPGAVGEIWIGGPSLARGYRDRPDLTSAVFECDPEEPERRFYRTGDLARWREDGTLEFCGRADQQVKIRGQRIELVEVEASLIALSGVTDAVAEVRPWQGEPTLVGYVVGAGNDVAWRAALRERLPTAMIPTMIVTLEALPLTPNGKVDRRRLPVPSEPPRTAVSGAQEAHTETEVQIAEVWCGVLRRKQVSLTDNFFDLGGHSLLLVDVQNRLQKTWDRPIPVVDLFAHPTVRSLAVHLEAQKSPSSVAPERSSVQDRASRQRAALARRRQTRKVSE
jgi:amino acid adenylation domain-containing protein